MDENRWLADRFEEHRPRLRAVAYRMLGSLTEADDAVQNTWLRLSRSSANEIDNLGGVADDGDRPGVSQHAALPQRSARGVARGARTRPRRKPGGRAATGGRGAAGRFDRLALLVVLDTLTPAERLAFVLHDMFDLPFEEIAGMVGRTPAAARPLASRARRRVKGADVRSPDADLGRQREVVDAFFSAARDGDFDALVAVLDRDVVLRIDGGAARPAASLMIQGAEAVAGQARTGLRAWFSRPVIHIRRALVNGAAGVVVTMGDEPMTVIGFTVADGRIVEIDAIADPERVRRIAAAVTPNTGEQTSPGSPER